MSSRATPLNSSSRVLSVAPSSEQSELGLADLSAAMDALGTGWSRLLEEGVDSDAMTREIDPDDGFQRRAPMGIRLAQALHHGNDHRSQICTALTTLGVEPPAVDAFTFGLQDGRVSEVPARP